MLPVADPVLELIGDGGVGNSFVLLALPAFRPSGGRGGGGPTLESPMAPSQTMDGKNIRLAEGDLLHFVSNVVERAFPVRPALSPGHPVHAFPGHVFGAFHSVFPLVSLLFFSCFVAIAFCYSLSLETRKR